jgi:hypothetical protein
MYPLTHAQPLSDTDCHVNLLISLYTFVLSDNITLFGHAVSYIPVNSFDSVFGFQFKSNAAEAGTFTLTSTFGFIFTVHVYSDPFHAKLEGVPFSTKILQTSNHCTDSVNIQVTLKLLPLIHARFVHCISTHGTTVSTLIFNVQVSEFPSSSLNLNSQFPVCVRLLFQVTTTFHSASISIDNQLQEIFDTDIYFSPQFHSLAPNNEIKAHVVVLYEFHQVKTISEIIFSSELN